MAAPQLDPSQPLRRILAATDFSDNATMAVAWATALAKAHAAPLTIVHGVHEVALGSLSRQMQDEIERRLEDAAGEARRAGVEVETRFETGRPWEVVSAVADEVGADVVVTGARGHTVLSTLRLGSTADRIVRTSRVPVVTVHPEDVDGGRPEPIRTVLAATDFSEEAELAVRTALRVIRPWTPELRVVLLHAWQPLVAYGFGTADGYAAAEVVDGAEEEANHLLESFAATLRDITPNVETALRQGYPARVIEREAGRVGADLIVLGTHGRGGLKHFLMGSIAERTLHHASCPVLTSRLPVEAEAVSAAGADRVERVPT